MRRDGLDLDRPTILRRFEAWLDEAMEPEEPPEGLAEEILSALASGTGKAPDEHCDTYSMWAALTAATREVKLQSRSFKQLSDILEPVGQLPGRVEAVLKAHPSAVAEIERQAEIRARRQVLDILLDQRERLRRGLAAASQSAAKMRETPRTSWFDRLRPKREEALQYAAEALSGLESAYRLNVESLDDALAGMDVREVDCLNQPFDPRTMSAVEVEETGRVPDGTVVAVYRRGYEWRGEVYRAAQVRVTRQPAPVCGGENE
ncbi:MAG: nucleotide exchange factor GrpE [bacterium]|nr:nucleotide exchange factor GrpE [bacterium]